jgi:deoxyadenosine/deoxycytidine kinase
MYYRVHEALAEKIPQPDLLVYLRASTPVLMQRIALRDRSYERNMEYAYIDELNEAYEDFISAEEGTPPILIIDTDNLDFVAHAEHLKWIGNRIRQELKLGPYQVELPLQP